MFKIISPLVILFFYACGSNYEYNPERNYENKQKEILTQFILAKDSSTIELPAGHFLFDKGLILEGKSYVTIKGQGIDKTVLSFKSQQQGAEGIRVANCNHIVLRDFSIEDAAGDNIKVTDTNHIIFNQIKCGWTGVVDKDNGAYGLYPVLCKNVIIKNSEVFGASDAGIYVGQSDTVLIQNNKAYWNVAGIESENSKNVIIKENEAYENTGGILVFDLPGLTQYGRDIEVFDNKVYKNNTDNFAPPGNIVGLTPAGTGILVLATTGVNIHDNEIIDNKTIGVGIISYTLVEGIGFETSNGGSGSRQELKRKNTEDVKYNPYVGAVEVKNNTYSNSHYLPDLGSEFGKLFLLKFGFNRPHVIWDGLESPEYHLENGEIDSNYKICVHESSNIKTANLRAGNDFKDLEVNPAIFNCVL